MNIPLFPAKSTQYPSLRQSGWLKTPLIRYRHILAEYLAFFGDKISLTDTKIRSVLQAGAIYVMMDLAFEWDPEKERENIKEHSVNFEAAERIFFDYHRMERHDDDSSDDEDRWQTMGLFGDVLLSFIRNGETLPG